MNIAVVEDDIKDIHRLEILFQKCKENSSHHINVDFYHSGEQFLKVSADKKYHLVIMDIYMDEIDGIETARRFKGSNKETLIAFLTYSKEDIWRAVGTHECFDYIQKAELDETRLEKLLSDVFSQWALKEKRLVFKASRQEISLRICNIQYVTAHDKYTAVVLKDGKEYNYRIAFSQLVSGLEEEHNFITCTRGVLLNMDYIENTDGKVFEMKDGMKFPIRRNGRRQIIDQYHEYQFEKLDKQEVFE